MLHNNVCLEQVKSVNAMQLVTCNLSHAIYSAGNTSGSEVLKLIPVVWWQMGTKAHLRRQTNVFLVARPLAAPSSLLQVL